MPTIQDGRFIGYPVDRMLAAFDDAARCSRGGRRAARRRAAPIGTSRSSAARRAPIGSTAAARRTGRSPRLRRLVSFTVMDQLPDFAWYEHAVRRRRGGPHGPGPRRRGEDEPPRARFAPTGAHFINYYGRFATEELERWRGPEPDIPSLMRR